MSTPTPEETTARAYATVLAHALFLASTAFARGDVASGQAIQSAVHMLMKAFNGPEGVPAFAAAMAAVLAETVGNASAAIALDAFQLPKPKVQ